LRGEVAPKIETAPMSSANAVLNRMRQGKIVGRVVLSIPG
jgi:D-arabinose 1-dehydrogenase-like Zn-dependent alcohol dehydrogenase